MEIALSGEYTIEGAEALRQQLITALGQRGPIILSFAGVQRADMSFFQVLHAVIQSGRKRGLSLELLPDLPAGLARKAALCGLSRINADHHGP